MALPYTIANGQRPDATKLMANFNYLLGGGLGTDTYTGLKTTAASAPTTPFLGIATGADGLVKGLFIYCGDVAQGDGGFFPVVTWE